MSALRVDPFEIAQRLVVTDASGEWFLAVADDPHAMSTAVAEELRGLVDDSSAVVATTCGDASSLVHEATTHPKGPLVLETSPAFAPDAWREVDRLRDNARRQGSTVVVTTAASAAAMTREAPHFASWISAVLRVGAPDSGEESARRERLLEGLRARFGLSDAEMVRRWQEGSLQAEPALAEWLVLLGRGDLVEDAAR